MSNYETVWSERFEALTCAAANACGDGLILEFGVASGATINYLATNPALRRRRIYGFDSFQGLPEAWGSCPVGTFACDLPRVADNVELVVGMFADTLPPFLREHKDFCALIHIDCDLYSSTRTVLHMLTSRIVRGTVIAMDEYYIAPEHEQRAFLEWLGDRKCELVCSTSQQAVVVME